MLSRAQFQLPDHIQSNKNVVGIVVVYSRIFRLIFPSKILVQNKGAFLFLTWGWLGFAFSLSLRKTMTKSEVLNPFKGFI